MQKRQIRWPIRGFGRVHCDECMEPLGYDYGSIAWRCRADDLCPTCAGKAAAEKCAAKFRAALAKPIVR